ncbi:energy transducer TonB [Gammaproteobacteria bacterium]|nr:energy transducer TonB [Gammaproteobacteria bacterium]
MKIMKELKKVGIGMFLTALVASLFTMNIASADKGYVGEDETEIEINRNYAKQPTYPRKALRMGTEGYVIVEFDVDTDGSVLDPYVLEAVPQGTFERSAIKAIRKWVYEAPTYKGQSVKANNVQVKLTFAFAD